MVSSILGIKIEQLVLIYIVRFHIFPYFHEGFSSEGLILYEWLMSVVLVLALYSTNFQIHKSKWFTLGLLGSHVFMWRSHLCCPWANSEYSWQRVQRLDVLEDILCFWGIVFYDAWLYLVHCTDTLYRYICIVFIARFDANWRVYLWRPTQRASRKPDGWNLKYV